MAKYRKTRHKTASKKKRVMRHSWVTLAIGAVVASIAIIIVIRAIIGNHKQRTPKITAFVEHFDVCGIDISHHQSHIDWSRLSHAHIGTKPILFVFLKATEGTTWLDNTFKQNFSNACKSVLVTGAYHFYIPTANPTQQANFFIKHVTLQRNCLPPILDVEQRGKASAEAFQRGVLEWLKRVEDHYGVKPIIYASAHFRRKHLTAKVFDEYPFWVAHYNVEQPQFEGEWTFWQFSESGQVEGIKGPVDLNVFHGTQTDLLRMTLGANNTLTNK